MKLLILLLFTSTLAAQEVQLDFIPNKERVARLRAGIGRLHIATGTYGVEAHGNRDTVYDKRGVGMTPPVLASWIRRDPRWHRGMRVALLACHTGSGDYAQRLADALGCVVVAPTARVWPLRGGGLLVAGGSDSADFGALGRMREFVPNEPALPTASATHPQS